jgi:hypothetical protein
MHAALSFRPVRGLSGRSPNERLGPRIGADTAGPGPLAAGARGSDTRATDSDAATLGFLGAARRGGPHELANPFGYFDRIIMLPNADYPPSRSDEPTVSVPVAGLIVPDLVEPVLGMRLGATPVLRASMPPATIDENGNLAAREDHIGASMRARNRRDVHAEAEPEGVAGRPQGLLWPGVPAPVRPHDRACSGRRGPRTGGRCPWLGGHARQATRVPGAACSGKVTPL